MSNTIPEYRVVPFRPILTKDSTYGDIAVQVHEIISQYVAQGWEYLSIEKVEATIQNKITGDEQTNVQVMIFKK